MNQTCAGRKEKEENERLRNVDSNRHKPHNFQLT